MKIKLSQTQSVTYPKKLKVWLMKIKLTSNSKCHSPAKNSKCDWWKLSWFQTQSVTHPKNSKCDWWKVSWLQTESVTLPQKTQSVIDESYLDRLSRSNIPTLGLFRGLADKILFLLEKKRELIFTNLLRIYFKKKERDLISRRWLEITFSKLSIGNNSLFVDFPNKCVVCASVVTFSWIFSWSNRWVETFAGMLQFGTFMI